MRLTCSILAFSLALVVAFSQRAVEAATLNATIGGQNYTIVEMDPLKSTDSPGNTLGVFNPLSIWTSTLSNNNDGLWNERAISAFQTGYHLLPGATNRVYEASHDGVQGEGDQANVPTLVTTVSGLPASKYDVFILYVTQDNGIRTGVRAALNSEVVSLGTDYLYGNALAFLAPPVAPGGWQAAIAKVGTTADAVTGFNVQIKALSAQNGLPIERSDPFAIAYRAVVPVPEPSSVLLATLGMATCLRLARRRRK